MCTPTIFPKRPLGGIRRTDDFCGSMGHTASAGECTVVLVREDKSLVGRVKKLQIPGDLAV